ncbi:Dyp-type peroxidase [Microbacterium soli]|uniref:Dyp-type peroxidase n=1 Tax=Microbacterium soli TaxID=446075 RepID=UPI0031E1535B
MDTPRIPQSFARYTVADLDLTSLADTLTLLGKAIGGLADPSHSFPDGVGDLTVLVGLGPRPLNALLPAPHDELLDMPPFRGDDLLDPLSVGGDLLLIIAASDPNVLDPAYRAVIASVKGVQVRWTELGFRGAGVRDVARNPLGFHDGIAIPRSPDGLADGVWIQDGPLSNGTICVIRRFVLDVDRFSALSSDEQNAIIGRDKVTGSPLTGGALHDDVDITAKQPDGTFIIPAHAHIRAAHPSFTGSPLMLRRSYGFTPSDASSPSGFTSGMLFTSFQNDIRTFVKTQQRMDESDALMSYARVTASAAFAVLPGYDRDSPLGTLSP